MNWAGYVQLVVIDLDQFAQDIVATEGPLLSAPPSPLFKASLPRRYQSYGGSVTQMTGLPSIQ
jgi:hypothetical protein